MKGFTVSSRFAFRSQGRHPIVLMRFFAILVCLAVLSCSRSRASTAPPVVTGVMERVVPGMVAGYVLDSTGHAINEAVVILDGRTMTRANTIGRFDFDGVAAGPHTLRAQSFGYLRATQTFALEKGSGATFVFRLNRSYEREAVIEEGCVPPVRPSVVVKAPAVAHAIATVAYRDAVQRLAFDSLGDAPDSSGMRSVSAFVEMAGRFDVSVTAPGYREWRTTVTVTRDRCHVNSETVTANLVRER